MTDAVQPVPVAGFESVERFDPPVESNEMIKNVAFGVIFVAVLGLVAPWMLTSFGVAPRIAWLIYLIVVVAVSGGLIIQQAHAQRTKPRASLTVGPLGFVYSNTYWSFELPWAGILKAGTVSGMEPVKTASSRHGGALTAEAIITALTRDSMSGVEGIGRLAPNPEAASLIMKMITQNHTAQGLVVGQPGFRTGIHLATFDPQWAENRIGAWLAAYRPDVVVEG